MIFEEKDIDFGLLDGTEFENLCYELLENNGFFDLKWIKGGGDQGRDIEAKINIRYNLLGERTETWYFECKNHTKGVGASEIHDKIGWATLNLPDKLIFLVSPHLTPDGKEYIKKSQDTKFKHIDYKESTDLKKVLLKTPILIEKYFISSKRKILINSIRDYAETGIMLDDKRIEIILDEGDLLNKYDYKELVFLLICCTNSNIHSDFFGELLQYIKDNSPKSLNSLLEEYNPQGVSSIGAGYVKKQTPTIIGEPQGLTPEELALEIRHAEYLRFHLFDYTFYSDEKVTYYQIPTDATHFLEILIFDNDINTVKLNLTTKEFYTEFAVKQQAK